MECRPQGEMILEYEGKWLVKSWNLVILVNMAASGLGLCVWTDYDQSRGYFNQKKGDPLFKPKEVPHLTYEEVVGAGLRTRTKLWEFAFVSSW